MLPRSNLRHKTPLAGYSLQENTALAPLSDAAPETKSPPPKMSPARRQRCSTPGAPTALFSAGSDGNLGGTRVHSTPGCGGQGSECWPKAVKRKRYWGAGTIAANTGHNVPLHAKKQHLDCQARPASIAEGGTSAGPRRRRGVPPSPPNRRRSEFGGIFLLAEKGVKGCRLWAPSPGTAKQNPLLLTCELTSNLLTFTDTWG